MKVGEEDKWVSRSIEWYVTTNKEINKVNRCLADEHVFKTRRSQEVFSISIRYPLTAAAHFVLDK